MQTIKGDRLKAPVKAGMDREVKVLHMVKSNNRGRTSDYKFIVLREVLLKAEEKLERKSQIKAQGIDFDKVVERIAGLL